MASRHGILSEVKFMEKEEIIFEHYKETCEICRNNEKDRNQLFVSVCILLTTLFLLMISETSVTGMFLVWIKEKFHYDLEISVDIIQSLVWTLLLYFTIRYYQLCIGIERLYHYIHDVEEKLSAMLGMDISREGRRYLQEYPMVLRFIWCFYTIFFPVVYFVLIVAKMVIELCMSAWNLNLFIHILIGLCAMTLTIFYMIFLHKNNRK